MAIKIKIENPTLAPPLKLSTLVTSLVTTVNGLITGVCLLIYYNFIKKLIK